MATPFASYTGGYQALPQGWMEAQMRVGDNYAKAIEGLGKDVAGVIGKYYQNKELGGINQEAAKSRMSQLEQLSQVTGQPIDPVLTERYANLGQMNTAQSGQFVKDIESAQQNALLMDRLRREKMAFDMQQQAAQRALQMQGLQQGQKTIFSIIDNASNPYADRFESSSFSQNDGLDPSLFPSANRVPAKPIYPGGPFRPFNQMGQ